MNNIKQADFFANIAHRRISQGQITASWKKAVREAGPRKCEFKEINWHIAFVSFIIS